MTNCEKIERRIARFGAELTDRPLLGLTALTVRAGGKTGVFIDGGEITTSAERAAIEAHECGHIATATTHALDTPFEEVMRQEYRADRWAVHYFLSPRKIKKAMRSGYTEAWQLAEYFDFDERFIRIALYVYRIEGKLNADL